MGKWILIGLLSIGVVVGIAAVIYHQSGLPPIVPAYPNAQQIATHTGYDAYYNVQPQITEFDTADSPETVLTFYDIHLTQRTSSGWQRHTAGDYGVNNCPRGWYYLKVKPTPQPTSLTHVVVTYAKIGCY